jgi:hypothetical protein
VLRRTPPSWTITLVLAACWLASGPSTADLAAQLHRVGVFAADGFAVWDNSWYGGHPLPDYSLTFPMLGATFGARLVGAAAAVASAALFESLLPGGRFRLASWWFAVGCIADLLVGRLTYALGVTAGLAAIAALTRGRLGLAVALGAACAATSPIAGLFLALAGVGFALARRQPSALAMSAAAGAVVVVLGLAFPEGGTQPFSLGSFAVAAAISLAAAGAVGTHRGLRTGLLLYAGTLLACFAIASPMGGNVVRLGSAFIAPALLLATGSMSWQRRVALVATLIAAALWQWTDPFTQAAHGWGDPSAHARYYRPLTAELRAQHATAGRVEVPFTRDHWETVYLARSFALARGLERQLDRRLNPLFYDQDHHLDLSAYHRWLLANAVRYVALPDVPMDGAGLAEAALVRSRPVFLAPVWHDAHWQLFRVRDAAPLAAGPATHVHLGQTTLSLTATRPGTILARVRWTPYWSVTGAGCVARQGSWTVIRAWRPGPLVLAARFSVRRLLDEPAACSAAPSA